MEKNENSLVSLNCYFDKKDIYEAYLYEVVKTGEYYRVVIKAHAAGVINDDKFLDFATGDIYNVIVCDSDAIQNECGEYIIRPREMYKESGKITPVEVLNDLVSKNSYGEEQISSSFMRKLVKR